MNISTIILSVLVIGFVILAVWNGINFCNLKRTSGSNNEQLNDSRYFELKYKQEFFIAIVSFITAVVVFLGYNSIDSIKSKLREDIELNLRTSMSQFDSVKGAIKKTDTALMTTKMAAAQYAHLAIENQIKQQQLLKVLSSSENKTQEFQKRIDELNKKNILKQKIYIVEGLRVDLKDDKPVEHRFADLRTVLDEPLPIFTKPPIIVATSNSGTSVTIFDVTTESFKISLFGYMAVESSTTAKDQNEGKLNLLISDISAQ